MRLLRYFIIIFSVSLCITAVCSKLMHMGLRRSKVDFYGKMNVAGDTARGTELLLIGSSRVLTQLNPALIDSIAGYNSFNYGLNASSIKTCANLLQYAAAHQAKARAVVLNIDYFMFNLHSDPYKDAYYYPYEGKDNRFILTDSKVHQWVHHLGIFDISLCDDQIKYAALDGFIHISRQPAGLYKGFYPHNEKVIFTEAPLSVIKPGKAEFEEAGFAALREMVKFCNENKLPLVFVIAPYYKQFFSAGYVTNFGEIISRVRGIADQYHVPLFDYSQVDFAGDTRLFFNVNHLNEEGARIYSALLANDLKKWLIKAD